MISTVETVFNRTRALLSDTQATGGEVFTDTYLQPYFSIVYESLVGRMVNENLQMPKQRVYYVVPAYTTQFSPTQANIANFGELCADGFQECGGLTTVPLVTASNTSPIQINTGAVPHNLATAQEVYIWGVAANLAANGRWFVTVIDPFNFTLNNSVNSNLFAGTGGSVTTTSEYFVPLVEQEELDTRIQPEDSLRFFELSNFDTFQLIGATVPVLVSIEFFSSGNAPLSGSLGIDNAQNYFAHHVAHFAAMSKDRVTEGEALLAKAVGPDGINGGFLGDLLNPLLKAGQRTRSIRPPYRRRGRYRGYLDAWY